MSSSTSRAHTEDLLDSDDFGEQSSFLGSGQAHSPSFEQEEDGDHVREVLSWKGLPWWRRPSPYWIIFGIPLGSVGSSALFAPKVALYTTLACRVHRPEFITRDHSLHSSAFLPTQSLIMVGATDAAIPAVFGGSEATVDAISILLPRSTCTILSEYSQSGPDPEQKCASDPVVQAVVARLNAVFATTMGILSCLTTGWWGSLSDRYGRRIVILVSLFGLCVTDIAHVITAWFMDVLPGGYWFPLVGYLVEGVCGSLSSGVAMYHAYLADTSDPSTRSRYFSLSLGFMFTGVAVGPVLGGLLIRSTGTILSVFYFAAILHGVYTILILFILPESLTRARARGARLRRRQDKANQVSSGRPLRTLKSITRVLSPLVVLLPEQSLDVNPIKRRRDWSLFCIAMAYGLVTSILGSFPYKFQYAAAQFDWTPEITSYYISFIGATRACFLAVILPLAIKYLKPIPIQLPRTPDEPLQGTVGSSPSPSAGPLSGSVESDGPEQRSLASSSPAFDLALARVSAGLDLTTYVATAVASTGTLFTLASTIGSFGAGFPPATQALAFEIYTNRPSHHRGEVGKLFGALSVIQALGSQIISPGLYGFIYSKTVATFPQAIMVVSSCTSLLALISLSFVRIPSKQTSDGVTSEHGNEEGNQDLGTPEVLVAVAGRVGEGRQG